MSIDCPREVYNLVSWSEWTAALPQEWTLFLPLNSRYIPMHDREVPAADADSADANGTEGGAPTNTDGADEVDPDAEEEDGTVNGGGEDIVSTGSEPMPSASTESSSSRGNLSRRGASNRSVV
jgi:hypothetical protein